MQFIQDVCLHVRLCLCRAGGGAGGSFLLKTGVLKVSEGTIRVNGGRGARSRNGDFGYGGGGGRVALYCETIVDKDGNPASDLLSLLDVQAFGGYEGDVEGLRSGPGTFYHECGTNGSKFLIVDNGENTLDAPVDALILVDEESVHFDDVQLLRHSGLRWAQTSQKPRNRTVFSISRLNGDTTGRWWIADGQIGMLNTRSIETPYPVSQPQSEHLSHGCSFTRLFRHNESVFTQISVHAYHIDDITLALAGVGIDVAATSDLVTPSFVSMTNVPLNLQGRWLGVEYLSLTWGARMEIRQDPTTTSEFNLKSLLLSGDAKFRLGLRESSSSSNGFVNLDVMHTTLLDDAELLIDETVPARVHMGSMALWDKSKLQSGRNSNLSLSEHLWLYNSSTLMIHGSTAIACNSIVLNQDSRIDGDGNGYDKCSGPGHPAEDSGRGASHGGLGSPESFSDFVSNENKMPANGDVFYPRNEGSGSCDPANRNNGASGGASLVLEAFGESELNGTITLHGNDGYRPTLSSHNGLVMVF